MQTATGVDVGVVVAVVLTGNYHCPACCSGGGLLAVPSPRCTRPSSEYMYADVVTDMCLCCALLLLLHARDPVTALQSRTRLCGLLRSRATR